MKKKRFILLLFVVFMMASVYAQQRRPIDSRHPLWLVHVDVWNKADPQKIIDQIPNDIRPYVCMNLSLSCQYDTKKNVYKMPQNAVRTYKSWGSICQKNGLWFTCQPASGGHTHIQDDDLETFEYFFKTYPNFLGWNYAEQFWGFDETNDKSSSSQAHRIALFAKLVKMSHQYGGFLTISFCGNVWSHPLNPMGMLKRNQDLLMACRAYPESILWLYKYTTSSCFYNNESMTIAPFISGLTKNYGVRYDNCGWNGAMEDIFGKNHPQKYPVSAGIGTVMEQTAMNGGAVWDGPELIWTEDFTETNRTNVDGYTRRNWTTFPGFRNIWIDMFRKIIDGSLYIPSREEVVGKTKVCIVNDINTGNDEDKYATWSDLYDGLYKQDDPLNKGNGQWMDNLCYFKKTGRYGTIPVVEELCDEVAQQIPLQIKKSERSQKWPTIEKKVADFNQYYPEISTGDLFVERFRNQLVTYTPYSYLNVKTSAEATIPLLYNTCKQMKLHYGKLSSGLIRESADHIDFYLNNYRTDTTSVVTDQIVIEGASSRPSFNMTPRQEAIATAEEKWDADTYTLNISHNGPVDIRIQCAGDGTGRLSDELPSIPLDQPVQPAAFNGEVIVEAEDMDFKDIRECVLDPYNQYPDERGNAGNGFADMGSRATATLCHQLHLNQSGEYRISMRYMAEDGGNITAKVNGSSMSLPLGKTTEGQWQKVTFTTPLSTDNNISYTNTGATRLFIDQVVYTPTNIEPEKYLVTVRDVDHATITPNVDHATEGEKVSLKIDLDPGYALKELRVVSSVYYSMNKTIAVNSDGNISFTMPDENITILPILENTALNYHLDFTNVNNGTIPEGWSVTQGNNEKHEYPSAYNSGSRTFSGFSGYQGKGLYWRERSAEYGRLGGYPLTLAPGEYKLSWAMAGWTGEPQYTACITNLAGSTLATSPSYTATPDVERNTSADISSAEIHTLHFSINTAGDYVIKFICPGGFAEYLLLDCEISHDQSTGIELVNRENTDEHTPIYNLAGQRVSDTYHGIIIKKGKKYTR